MKINDKVLYIPPFISTSWNNVQALTLENHPQLLELVLCIILHNGQKILIPGLSKETISTIFDLHRMILDRQIQTEKFFIKYALNNLEKERSSQNDPIMILEHDEALAKSPVMPEEVLNKISSVAKALLKSGDIESLPQPYQDCLCPHCQVSRAVLRGYGANEDHLDEVIDEGDLSFSPWIIESQSNENFLVTDSCDPTVSYQVTLKPQVSCSCGDNHCEHIKAVLMS